MTKKAFFFSLTIKYAMSPGFSANIGAQSQMVAEYFSTQAKLDRWRKKNPTLEKDAVFGMHEISIDCAKEIVKLSKKKEKCRECGK